MTIIEDAVKRLEKKKGSPEAPAEHKIDDTLAEVVLQDAEDTGEYQMPAEFDAEAKGVETTGRHRIVQVNSDALRAAGFLAPEDEERQLVLGAVSMTWLSRHRAQRRVEAGSFVLAAFMIVVALILVLMFQDLGIEAGAAIRKVATL